MGKRSKSRNRTRRESHDKDKSDSSNSRPSKQEEGEEEALNSPFKKQKKEQVEDGKQQQEQQQPQTKSLAAPRHATAKASGPLTYSSGLHVSYHSGNNCRSPTSTSSNSIMNVPPPLTLLEMSDESTTKGGNHNTEGEDNNIIAKNMSKVWKYLGNSKKHKKRKRNSEENDRPSTNDNNNDERWRPTPIQRQSWSILLNSQSLIGIAPTGSGKTFAYAIPTLVLQLTSSSSSLSSSSASSLPISSSGSILVLLPTRELCHQVAKVFTLIAKAINKTCSSSRPVRVVTIHGGVDRKAQVQALEGKQQQKPLRPPKDLGRNHDNQTTGEEGLVVVATPGRYLDLLEERINDHNTKNDDDETDESNNSDDDSSSSKTVYAIAGSARSPRWIVLDEADQLTKEGDLGPQVDKILSLVGHNSSCSSNNRNNNNPATLALVSATYPEKCHLKFRDWVGSDHILVQVDSLHKQTTNQQQPHKERDPEASTGATKVPSQDDQEFMKISHPNEESLDATSPKIDADVTVTRRDDSAYSRIPSHLIQVVHVCAEHKKARKLIHTLKTVREELCQSDNNNNKKSGSGTTSKSRNQQHLGIVFFGKIDKLKYVTKLLQKEQVKCVELHSQLPRHTRERNLTMFSSGQVPLVMATDLAARGIDIPHVRFVVQYDFPGNLDQYIHRCGRAGRRSGNDTPAAPLCKVYSFFTRNLQPMAADLIHLLEANQAWVDPNLRLLVSDNKNNKNGGKTTKKAPKRETNDHRGTKQSNQAGRATGKQGTLATTASESKDQVLSDHDDDEDEFSELSPKRIVLKRASHVSDASSDESSDSE